VGQTPEIIGYYAANLNSGMPTVRSANPNAFLFAFKNWTLPRSYWANSQDLYTPVEADHPRKGLRKPPSNKLVEVQGIEPWSEMFISS
jgi:hypothetical protein